MLNAVTYGALLDVGETGAEPAKDPAPVELLRESERMLRARMRYQYLHVTIEPISPVVNQVLYRGISREFFDSFFNSSIAQDRFGRHTDDDRAGRDTPSND